MTDELRKEALEIMKRLYTTMDGLESDLNRIAIIGCDAHKIDVVLRAAASMQELVKIQEEMDYYRLPTSWK